MGNTLCGSVGVIAIPNAHTQDDATDSLSLRCIVGHTLPPLAAHMLLIIYIHISQNLCFYVKVTGYSHARRLREYSYIIILYMMKNGNMNQRFSSQK